MQFFKRFFMLLTFAVGLLLPITNVYASDLHLLFGADFLISDVKYNSDTKADKRYKIPKKDFQSIAPIIGLSAYGIGLEAYILNSRTISSDTLEAKLRAYGFDVFGEANLSDNFSLIASLGMAKYTFKVTKDNRKQESDCSGPRLGIGLQYYITNNIAVQGMYHYTLLNSGNKDLYDAISEFSAGIRFIF